MGRPADLPVFSCGYGCEAAAGAGCYFCAAKEFDSGIFIYYNNRK
jgi:hypothetical protein